MCSVTVSCPTCIELSHLEIVCWIRPKEEERDEEDDMAEADSNPVTLAEAVGHHHHSSSFIFPLKASLEVLHKGGGLYREWKWNILDHNTETYTSEKSKLV